MLDILKNALQFLLLTAIDFYVFILVIRFILAWSGASNTNPLTHFIIKLTNSVTYPLRKIIPPFKKIELSTLFLIILLEMVRFLVFALFTTGMPNILGLLFLSIGTSIDLIIQAFFYAIILQVILSWVQPHSPINHTLRQFIAPVIWPIQRVMPSIGGLDLSPVLALILLQLLTIVLIGPIKQIGFMHW